MSAAKVDVYADHVSISDDAGEIVYWDSAEWTEDPSILPAIVQAVVLALTNGPEAVRKQIIGLSPSTLERLRIVKG